jgi:hypothetical protein
MGDIVIRCASRMRPMVIGFQMLVMSHSSKSFLVESFDGYDICSGGFIPLTSSIPRRGRFVKWGQTVHSVAEAAHLAGSAYR